MVVRRIGTVLYALAVLSTMKTILGRLPGT
jgi:hypothetical protein